MKKVVNKNVLNPYIDVLISQLKFLYGINYAQILETRLKAINKVYISDEISSETVMAYNTLEDSINMNSSFLSCDFLGNYKIDYNRTSTFIKHSIIHELLHAASSRKGICGIAPIIHSAYKNALNEGITQMLADDICGYYENKFLGSYNVEKIIANILRTSLGNDVILRSYFLDENLINYEVNKLSHSKNYYTYLNVILTRYSATKDDTKIFRLDDLLKSVVINIVIPKYRSLSENSKEAYITKLLSNISGDEEVKNKIIDYINKYLKLSYSELQQENDQINDNLVGYEEETTAIKDLNDVQRFIVRDNGEIYSLDGKTKITSRENKEKIYTKLFELNGYKRFLDENTIDLYVKALIKGGTFSINYDSILKRRIIFCGIKELLLEKGYIVLNDYEELDKSKSIVLRYINNKATFLDYKKMCENFSLCKTRVGKNEYSYSVIYNSTKNELENNELKKMALYSLNWMNSVQDKGREGINDAFSPANEYKFFSIFLRFCDRNQMSNKFDESVISRFSKYKDIISKMLETPIKAEWVLDFIGNIDGRGTIKEKKGLSKIEEDNPNYIIDRIREESREIVRQNK